jgi:hypothetical protein
MQGAVADMADIEERRWDGCTPTKDGREAESPAEDDIDDEREPPVDGKLILV